MFAKIIDNALIKWPYTRDELYQDTPNVYLNSTPDDQLAAYGAVIVQIDEQPQITNEQNAIRLDPVLEDGTWVQRWQIVAASEAEITQRNAAQADQVREERNGLLTASDWTQVADAPVDKAAWAAYRQELRDISAQEGFPWTVTWPEMP